jgi:hypothetical protein
MLGRRHFRNFFVCGGSTGELHKTNATARIRIGSETWQANIDDRELVIAP